MIIGLPPALQVTSFLVMSMLASFAELCSIAMAHVHSPRLQAGNIL
jgi:hypothetical protein